MGELQAARDVAGRPDADTEVAIVDATTTAPRELEATHYGRGFVVLAFRTEVPRRGVSGTTQGAKNDPTLAPNNAT